MPALRQLQHKKVPKQNDIIVGGNVRRLRLRLEMSQEKLGDALGLTFQQVQKYEKGTNRIGSSRLVEIATILRCSLDELFAGVIKRPSDGKSAPLDPLHLLINNPRGTRLAQAFPKLTPREQLAFINVMEETVEDR